MKKELLTGALATTMALTSSAHWGRGGCYGWPAIGFGLLAGGLAARAYTDAVWASRGYVPYGYGVAVAPTVVYPTTSVVYQQPAPVVYQQSAQQVVYPQQVQQPAPAVQPAPQPQEIRIVVDHQCAVQTSVTTNTVQLQRQ